MNINSKLRDIFGQIKKDFTVKKTVDFPDFNLHIEMESPTSADELKIMEACKPAEGAEYLDALKKNTLAVSIKKINDIDLSLNEVEYSDEDGQPKTMTKYLFLLEQIEGWPTVLKDVLFLAFSDMQNELEHKVNTSVKFEHFNLTTVPEQEKSGPSGMKVVKEAEDTDLTEVDKQARQVEREIDEADRRRAQAEMKRK